MSFIKAIWLYIFFLFLGIFAGIILMPQTINLATSTDGICRALPKVPSCQTLFSFVPEWSMTVTQPEFGFGVGENIISKNPQFVYGTDILGGTRLTVHLDMNDVKPEEKDKVWKNTEAVLQKRLDFLHFEEYRTTLSRSGNEYHILIDLPNVYKKDDTMAVIGTTAHLEFREYKPTTPSGELIGKSSTESAKQASSSGYLTKDFVATDLTGKDVTSTKIILDEKTKKPVLSFYFSDTGKEKLKNISTRSIGKPLALFLDEFPLTAPVVQEPLDRGLAQLTGNFSENQIRSLAAVVDAGVVPVPIQIIKTSEQASILGTEALTLLFRAGAIACVAVMLFLLFHYRLAGVVGSVSLLYVILILAAVYKFFAIPLSLSSIVGIIVAIGVSTDSSILYFEKLKEEEDGMIGRSASVVETSFRHAFRAILDSNVMLLLVAFVLANPFSWTFLQIGGPIQGFAVALALGIAINVCCGLVGTKVLSRLFYSSKRDPEELI